MKKLFVLFITLCSFSLLFAKPTADYIFSLVIDENIKDLSGNHRVPECHFAEDDFVSGDFDSVRFRKTDHAVKVPFSAFPGKSGNIAIKFNPEKLSGDQVLFRVYSLKGDGFTILLRNGKLRGSYFNRAAKKHFHIHGPELKTDQWYDISFSWKEGDKISMQCNNWKSGRRLYPGMKMNFADNSVIFVGNSYDKKNAITGKLHRFTINSGAKITAENRATSAKQIIHECKLGAFSIKVNKLGEIAGLSARDTDFVSAKAEPLWQIKTVDKKSGKFRTLLPEGTPEIKSADKKLTLKWKYVTAEIYSGENDTLIWKLHAKTPDKSAIDSIEYPRLRLQPTCKSPEDMRFVYPSYFGCSMPDPFSAKDGKPRRFGNTYGGGAHYQFCYMHAPDKPGLYVETRDSMGRIKEFRFVSDDSGKTGLFYLNLMPELRMTSTEFTSKYEIRTSVMQGDWYDAAKRYRKWAIKQQWCRNGKLHENKVVPQWLKECDFAVRLHTWYPKRKLSTNIDNANFLARTLNNAQSLGIWYNLTYLADGDSVGVAAGSMAGGNARSEARYVPGGPEAMATFKRNNQNFIHYINSRIYDQSKNADHAESKYIRPMVMRDFDGSMQLYGKLYYEGCRVDPRWQEHQLKLIKKAVAAFGFRGTYLDSFGRGQEFCYASNHGHKIAEDCGSVQGQRAMAERIKTEMRKQDPHYILCSEASIEQFIDYIDVKLHHYNLFQHSVPIWAAVYHDYQIVHGRSMNSEAGDTPESNAVLASAAFHNGAIIGRFFADRTSFADVYCLDVLGGFYRQIAACRRNFRDHLTLGEMLRPPRLSNITVPQVRIGIRKRKFDHPAVSASLWQSPAGQKAMFVTNSSGKEAESAFHAEIKPDTVVYFKNDGSTYSKPFNGDKIVLPPFSVAALVEGSAKK